MKSTPYQIGYYYERRAMKYLEKEGYGSISSRGSHKIDIIAWLKTNIIECIRERPLILFVFLKKGSPRKLPKEEMDYIKRIRKETPACIQVETWFWKEYAREPIRFVIKDME